MSSPTRTHRLLEALGLHRPELRAWAMYDWAITGMYAVIIVAVFPIYFQRVAAQGLDPTLATQHFATATTLALAIVAAIAPVVGAIADFATVKKRFLGTFAGIGIAAVAGMYFIQEGDWLLAAGLFMIANLGANGSMIFYDAMLPHIAREHEIDRVSTAGFAVGYAGATLLLTLNLAMIMKPAWFFLPVESTLPSRLAFITVAIWWLAFSIPLFRRVPEPPLPEGKEAVSAGQAVRRALGRLRHTFGELRGFKNAFVMLLAFLIYNDGIGTIIRMATIYGTELGIEQAVLIGSIVLVQIVGVPFTFIFGTLAGRFTTRTALFFGLFVYMGISVLAYFMTSWVHFVLLALLVGTVQGGTQALSRSLFASLIPRHKSGEFFGFFAVFEKFAGIFGPAIFSVMIIATGSSRQAILSVIGFFIIGGLLLLFVDVDEGRAIARKAEKERADALAA